MLELIPAQLRNHRAGTFHLPPLPRINSPDQALEWVNQRGFAYFWPIKGIDLPSLWVTVAGDRPVADAHDDPGHVTWGWKDQSLGKKRWYYAKILRKKATIVSLEVAPYFYALTENYGTPEEDHLIMYLEGRMTLAAKQIYEALLKEGPLNTIDLRKAARLTSKQSDTEFARALDVLQADFKILPVGVAEAGAWKYAFIYDITPHHFPELPELAREISEAQARTRLLSLFFQAVGAAQLRDVQKLFGWAQQICLRTLNRLVESGELVTGVENPGLPGEWYALPPLVREK